MQPILETRDLTVYFGKRCILRDVAIRFNTGTLSCLTGQSGIGKTTLLRCLNRLIDFNEDATVSGSVLYKGSDIIHLGRREVDKIRSEIGMVFQKPIVFPVSIMDNLLFGARRLSLVKRKEEAHFAEELLSRVALWNEVRYRLNEAAATLSIGQQQRLCLARTLAMSPKVILMDEPTSSLDLESTLAIERLALELKRDSALVWVSHDIEQVRRIADDFWSLVRIDGVGRVTKTG